MFVLLIPQSAPAQTTIEDRAIAMGLHDSPAWHALMHYRPGLTGKPKSMVDDPKYFLAPTGKTDPEAELRATIQAFLYSPDPQSAIVGKKEAMPPPCRFPARYEWLMDQLQIEQMPPTCPKLDEFMAELNPMAAALVMPEAHINSPASMFGHTLLRFDSSYESGLLSYSVSYAAHMPHGLELGFAIKGIFGGYKGILSIDPYYDKINKYTHIESRDIWEYGLNLSPAEVRQMALHVWELKDMSIDYYFIDDNCSYLLLFIIEAGRPEAGLTSQFIYPVTPVDTVRAVIKSGLVNDIAFRPSKATRIASIEGITETASLRKSLLVAEGTLEPDTIAGNPSIQNNERVRILELASEYLQMMTKDFSTPLDKETYSARYLATLKARSTLGRLDYAIVQPASPEQGHETARITLGGGRLNGDNFMALNWRPSYHGLMDMDMGYKTGAAISFLDTELRHYERSGKTVLKKLMLIDITSLTPGGNFINPLSWRMRLGAERETGSESPRTPVILKGGFGFTGRLAAGADNKALAWIMFDQALKADGSLIDGYALGGGLSAGAMLQAAQAYKIMASVNSMHYGLGHKHREVSGIISQTIKAGKQHTINLKYERGRLENFYFTEISLGWNLYF